MRIVELLRARNAEPGKNRPVIIACLGDSVTHSCFEVVTNRQNEVDSRHAPGEGYVRRLQDRLDALFPVAAAAVINCGVGGDNAANACARFDRDVARLAPDLVVVALGLNDSVHPDAEAGLAAYVEALRGIFARTLALGAEAIFLSPNRMCSYVDPRLPEGDIREIAARVAEVQNSGTADRYVAAARRVAAEMGVPVADAHAAWDALEAGGVNTTELLANYINHPTPEMHDIFVEALLKTMFAG